GRYFWELRSCAYWDAFEVPKIIVPAIVSRSEAGPDIDRHYCNNKATIFLPSDVPYTLALTNSSMSDWFARQTFASKQGGFLDYEPRYSGTIPIPNATDNDQAAVAVASRAIIAGADRPRLEALINAFV